MNYKNIINKQYCNFVKQSKAKRVLYLLINNNFKFLFQKYFLNLVKSFLTLIKFNFDSLFLVINKNSFLTNFFRIYEKRHKALFFIAT